MHWIVVRLMLTSAAWTMAQAQNSNIEDCQRSFACRDKTCHIAEDCLNATEKNEIFYIKVKSQELDSERILQIKTLVNEYVINAIRQVAGIETPNLTTEPERATTSADAKTSYTEKLQAGSNVPRTVHVVKRDPTTRSPCTEPSRQLTESHSGTHREITTEATWSQQTSASPNTTSVVAGTTPTETDDKTKTSDVSTTSALPSTSSDNRSTDGAQTTSKPTELSSTEPTISTVMTTTNDVKNKTAAYQVYFLTEITSDGSPKGGSKYTLIRAVAFNEDHIVFGKDRLPYDTLSLNLTMAVEKDPHLNGTTIKIRLAPDESSFKSSKAKYFWIAAVVILIILAIAAIGLKVVDAYNSRPSPEAPPAAATQTNPVEMIPISRRHAPFAADERCLSVRMSSIDGRDHTSSLEARPTF